MQELGPEVDLTTNGSIDTTNLTPFSQWFSKEVGAINAAEGQIILGAGVEFGDRYVLTTGADNFGTGNGVNASSFAGDPIDLHGLEEFIGLPPGYISGAPITTTMTFAGQTFATLGMRPGTYDWRFEDGQTVTLQIGAGDAVPEHSAMELLAIGGLSLAAMRRRAGA